MKQSLLKAYSEGKTITELCKLFNVCRETIYNWRHNIVFKKEGPKNDNTKYNSMITEFILKYITDNHKFRIQTLIKLINKKFNVSFNANNIYYVLRRNNVTYKRAHKRVIIKKKSQERSVEQLKSKINDIKHDNVISIDEAHYTVNLTNKYAK